MFIIKFLDEIILLLGNYHFLYIIDKRYKFVLCVVKLVVT